MDRLACLAGHRHLRATYRDQLAPLPAAAAAAPGPLLKQWPPLPSHAATPRAAPGRLPPRLQWPPPQSVLPPLPQQQQQQQPPLAAQ